MYSFDIQWFYGVVYEALKPMELQNFTMDMNSDFFFQKNRLIYLKINFESITEWK